MSCNNNPNFNYFRSLYYPNPNVRYYSPYRYYTPLIFPQLLTQSPIIQSPIIQNYVQYPIQHQLLPPTCNVVNTPIFPQFPLHCTSSAYLFGDTLLLCFAEQEELQK